MQQTQLTEYIGLFQPAIIFKPVTRNTTNMLFTNANTPKQLAVQN